MICSEILNQFEYNRDSLLNLTVSRISFFTKSGTDDTNIVYEFVIKCGALIFSSHAFSMAVFETFCYMANYRRFLNNCLV